MKKLGKELKFITWINDEGYTVNYTSHNPSFDNDEFELTLIDKDLYIATKVRQHPSIVKLLPEQPVYTKSEVQGLQDVCYKFGEILRLKHTYLSFSEEMILKNGREILNKFNNKL